MKVVAVAHGWNEAENLPLALKSTNDQENIRFDAKVYVDDASVDGSAGIAESLGWDIIRYSQDFHESILTDWTWLRP